MRTWLVSYFCHGVYSLFFLILLVRSVGAFIIDPAVTPWTSTAMGDRSGNGVAGPLTWSIVPDGTSVTDGLDNLGGSDLLAFLTENFDGVPFEPDHTQQPWFSIFEASMDRWSELSGVSLIYEPNDDGGRHNRRPGVLGVRGDIRIGGASIDGRGNTLAFNFLPEFGGDMVLDTDDIAFADPDRQHLFLRNTIMHELGHAFGLSHVRSNTDRLLMEAFTDTSIEGPQLDEVRGVQFYFGDAYERDNDGLGNGSVSLASDLGELAVGGSLAIGTDGDVSSQAIAADAIDFVSISNQRDLDFYAFTVTEPASLSVALTPLGGTFSQSGEFGRPRPFAANARSDLSLSVLDADGATVLGVANEMAAGDVEELGSIPLQPGTYVTRVEGEDEDSLQLYMLELNLSEFTGDCNGDGLVDASDLSCGCSFGVDAVLAGLDIGPGDLNADGQIDFDDFVELSRNFGAAGTYAQGDLNCDGHVEFSDFVVLSNHFGDGRTTAASVPEPAGCWAIVVGLLPFLVKLRNK